MHVMSYQSLREKLKRSNCSLAQISHLTSEKNIFEKIWWVKVLRALWPKQSHLRRKKKCTIRKIFPFGTVVEEGPFCSLIFCPSYSHMLWWSCLWLISEWQIFVYIWRILFNRFLINVYRYYKWSENLNGCLIAFRTTFGADSDFRSVSCSWGINWRIYDEPPWRFASHQVYQSMV